MKVFKISFVVFLVLFGAVYFFAVQSGAPGLGEDIPVGQALGGALIAISVFSFWMTMIVHCISSNNVGNRIGWGLGLILFSWVAAIIYFFVVYRKDSGVKDSGVKS